MPDPVLDPGVSTMPGFEERQLADRGVGDEDLLAPAVALFEQRQLGARARAFAAQDDPHPVGRLGSTVGSTMPVSSRTSPPSQIPPAASTAGVQTFFGTRSIASRSASVIGNPAEYSTLRTRTRCCSMSQSSSVWEAPAPSARINSFLSGPLGRGGRVLLLAVGDHDRGVGVEHDHVVQVGAGNLARRDTTGTLSPHMAIHIAPAR